MNDLTCRRRWAGPALAALLALTTASLSGCATPTYPTDVNATKLAGASADGPAVATAPSSSDQGVVEAAPPEPAPTPSAAPPPASVETAPLPPVTREPIPSNPPPAASALASQPPATTATPSSPAQAALPPSYTPPAASASEPRPPSSAPILAAPPSPAVASPRPVARAAPPPRKIAAPTQTIRYRQIPGRLVAGGRVVAATGMYRDYLVQPRDHLDAIARDLGATRKVLVEANSLKPPYALQPGQHLKVPVAKAYQADASDSLLDVAKRFSLSPAALADLNDLPEKAKLRAGDRIALPDRFEDRGPTRLASTTVAERVAAPAPRPTYASTPPKIVAASSYTQPRSDGAPYVPSPAALAAAQRLAVSRSYGSPSYVPGRPGPNAQIATQGYRPPPYKPQAYEGPEFGGRSPAALAVLARGRFIWPVRGTVISAFGIQGIGRRNDGIDIRSPAGSPVRVAAGGQVVYAGNEVPGFGNLVLVKHPDGWVTAYAHLASIGVQMRQAVVQGQTLGDVGATGSVPEAQLHFEVRYAATPMDKPRPIDPMLVLPR